MKKYIRKLIFDLVERLPYYIAKHLADGIVRFQSKVYFDEVQSLSSKYPAKSHEIDIKIWKRILIVRLDAIGDMVWTTAFLRELRDCFPYATIDMIVRPIAKDVLANCPYVNQIFPYDCKIPSQDAPSEYVRMRNKARLYMDAILEEEKRFYDVVFLPREILCGNGIQNLYLAAYSKAPVRIGRSYATNMIESVRCNYIRSFFSVFVEMQEPKHEAVQILDLLVSYKKRIKNDKMELWLSDAERDYGKSFLIEHNIDLENEICIVVGLEGSTPNRSWNIDNFHEVFRNKKQFGNKTIRYVLLSHNSLPLNARAIFEANHSIIDLTKKTTIRQAIAIIATSSLYLGADTGLMHIAAAFGKPIIELSAHFQDGRVMDSGSPILVGPWRVPYIVLAPLTGSDGCIGWCDKSYSHCINKIEPREVIFAIDTLCKDIEKGETDGGKN